MKRFILLTLLPFTLLGSTPSKLKEPARFYSADFPYKEGMKVISYETQVGLIGDEVFIGRPRVYVNDSICKCSCGKEAVSIAFKKGDMTALCEEHETKKEPVNSKYSIKE